MIETLSPRISISDRIRLPFNFKVDRMIEEFHLLKPKKLDYYDVIELRAPSHTIDKSLPLPKPVKNYADGSWTTWMNSPQLEKSEYLRGILEIFDKHTEVRLVRLLRLAPNAVVHEHTDPSLGLDVSESVIRLTIPIMNQESSFLLNGVKVNMEPGDCWYLNLTNPHKVINKGKQERVNLTIDIVPNDWVRDLIKKATI